MMPMNPNPPRETAEQDSNASADDGQIGQQIRELRRVKRMNLQQLADAVGVSVGYLSQVERNRSKLPVATLRKICDVLGIHISWFFHPVASSPGPERDLIVRRNNRRSMNFTALGIHEELLSPNLSGPLELMMTTFEPGAESGENSHDGAEAGVLISGVLELWINDTCFTLESGDSFSFNSKDRHRTRNPSASRTTAFWVITPPYY